MNKAALYVLVLGLPLLTIAANFEAGRLVRGALIVGIGLAFLDAVKCSLPFLVRAGWAGGRRFTAVIGALLMLALAVLSGLAAQGLLAHLMTMHGASVTNANTLITDVRTELADIAQRLQRDGWARPLAQVNADIDAERRSLRFTETNGCTSSATGAQARTFCTGLDKLRGEAAAAERAEALRTREAELRTKRDAIGVGPMPVGEDLTMMAALTGLDAKRLHWWIAALLAIALEVAALTVPVLAAAALQPPATTGSPVSASLRDAIAKSAPPRQFKASISTSAPLPGTGGATVLAFRRLAASDMPPPGGDATSFLGSLAVTMEAKPSAPLGASSPQHDVNAEASVDEARHLDKFVTISLIKDEASSISGSALREAYERHCASIAAPLLDRNRFGILMSRRFEKQKQRGVMVYFGIRAAGT